MTELEKIAYAKTFIDKLSKGINPLDNTPIPEGDIANNGRLSRCFSYVSDILGQVIENGGTFSQRTAKRHRESFYLTEEEKSKISPSDTALTISEISDRLNSVINVDTTKKISAASVNNWLVSLGLLEVTVLSNGESKKMPTQNGKAIGIYYEERMGVYGKYITVLYSPEAQQFIYDNVDGLIESKKKEKRPKPELSGSGWTAEDDRRLTELYKNNTAVPEMAAALKRTNGGIRVRLKRLGLVESLDEIT